MVGCLEGKGETGYAAPDNEKIAFYAHDKLPFKGCEYWKKSGLLTRGADLSRE